jgi:hypothetical protein
MLSTFIFVILVSAAANEPSQAFFSTCPFATSVRATSNEAEGQPSLDSLREPPTPPVGPAEIGGFKYADYPISKIYGGKIIFPHFSGRDKDFAQFRTRIRDGMRNGPNFAGRYSVIKIGCGTGCRFYIIGDTATGSLRDFPLGGEEYGHLDLYYSLHSALIVAVWDDYDRQCFQEAFKIANGSVVSLKRSSALRTDGHYCTPQ